jgi:OHS family lactose permease-like MFS transporter
MSAFIFLYFFTWSSSFGLYALWLSQKVGLDSITIGSVFAINGVFAVILKPVYGYIMDKIGMSKWLLYFVCAVSALMAPFFVFVYQPCCKATRRSASPWRALFKSWLVCGRRGIGILCRSL